MLDNINGLLKKDFTQFFLANVIFSISTFIVNVCMPKLLEQEFFNNFIYIFQMVLFSTTIMQAGLVIGLYHYYESKSREALNIYYSFVLIVNVFIFLLGFIDGNIVSSLLKLGSLSRIDHLMFYLSVMVSGIYLFNKGKNVSDKAYRYMMRISVTSFLIRMLVLIMLYFINVKSLALVLFLVFILPYSQDLHDYIVNTFKYVRPRNIDCILCKRILIYCFKVWLTGCLFMISDKIFLISNKEADLQFTTAIAFSAGFVGIISLFNSCFNNYFLSRLSCDRKEELKAYTDKLKRFMPLYILLLAIVSALFALFVYLFYPALGTITAMVTFIILLRSGLISYLGMFALLSKVLNLLNIEVVLNVCRVIAIYGLCHFWHPQSLLLWYIVVMFTIPFPELIMSFIVNRKIQCETTA